MQQGTRVPETAAKGGKMRVVEEPEESVRLELKCEKCGKVATYDVGRVVTWQDEEQPEEPKFGYTAYFRCKQCHAAGPWTRTAKGTIGMIARLGEAAATEGEAGRLFLGKLSLYDGTFISSPAEGEEILRARLESDPRNAFLWTRLGNLLDNAGQTQPAKNAFARALEINDFDIEAHYRLGVTLCNENALDDATVHLHRVLRLGRKDTVAPPKLRRDIVVASLKLLFEMSFQTNGRIKAIPAPSPEDLPAPGAEQPTLLLKTHDIHSEEDLWKACKSMAGGFLREDEAREAEHAENGAADFAGYGGQLSEDDLVGEEFDSMEDGLSEKDEKNGPIFTSPRVGRNDPCPCGSGKKFKKCCGRS